MKTCATRFGVRPNGRIIDSINVTQRICFHAVRRWKSFTWHPISDAAIKSENINCQVSMIISNVIAEDSSRWYSRCDWKNIFKINYYQKWDQRTTTCCRPEFPQIRHSWTANKHVQKSNDIKLFNGCFPSSCFLEKFTQNKNDVKRWKVGRWAP